MKDKKYLFLLFVPLVLFIIASVVSFWRDTEDLYDDDFEWDN